MRVLEGECVPRRGERQDGEGGEGWGRAGGSPVPVGESVGEKHGSAMPRVMALEHEPRGSGALSTSSGSLNWPGKLLHRPALSAQSPCTCPSWVASWDGSAAVPDHRAVNIWQDSISCGPEVSFVTLLPSTCSSVPVPDQQHLQLRASWVPRALLDTVTSVSCGPSPGCHVPLLLYLCLYLWGPGGLTQLEWAPRGY